MGDWGDWGLQSSHRYGCGPTKGSESLIRDGGQVGGGFLPSLLGEGSGVRLSVITVCYQAAEMLQKTIDSVSQQDYKPLEYIVVDGGSTDATLDIIARHQDIITRWVSEPDRGIYDAMNKGVTMATGEWVIFMNAGDTFAAPDVLRRSLTPNPSPKGEGSNNPSTNELQPDGDSTPLAYREGQGGESVDTTPLPSGGAGGGCLGGGSSVLYGSVIKNGQVIEPHRFTNPHRMPFCHQSSLTRTSCLRQQPFDISHRMSADLKFFKQLLLAGHQFQQVPFPIAVFDTTGVSNARRSAGLADNIRVIREVDNWRDRLRLLPRLYFVYLLCRLKGK